MKFNQNWTLEQKNELFPNTKVFAVWVEPLFSRGGVIVWEGFYLHLFKGKEKSHILSDAEREVYFQNSYKYIRVFKDGFKTLPFNKVWLIDSTWNKYDLLSEELHHQIIIYATNDEKDWKFIKTIEE